VSSEITEPNPSPNAHLPFRVWWLDESAAETITAAHAQRAAELYAESLGCKRIIVTTHRVSTTRWVVTRIDTHGETMVTTYKARMAREDEEE
jgi:hypothetical protein